MLQERASRQNPPLVPKTKHFEVETAFFLISIIKRRFKLCFLLLLKTFLKNHFFEVGLLTILANVRHFQNALIFRILSVFWSGVLHTPTLTRSYNRFSHLFGIFNF